MRERIEEAAKIIQELLSGKVDAYEAYFSFTKGISVEAKNGRTDSIKVRAGCGAGIRTVSGQRPGFAYTTVFDKESLAMMVKTAIDGSKGAARDEYLTLPKAAEGVGADLGLMDPSFGKVPEEEIIARAIEIEKSAKGFDSRVKRVRKASYGESYGASRIINSSGVDVFTEGTFYSGSVMAVAEENGGSEMGWDAGFSHKRNGLEVEAIGTGAARQAVEQLGGKTIDTVRCPAVFENTVVIEFLDVFASAFLADNVIKGKSMLGDKVGKKVVSEKINLYDDGLLKGGWGSSLFDSEGVPSQTTALIKDGVCSGFLYDTYWAGRAGKASTGNASRGGFKGSTTIGISNLYLDNGSKSFDAVLSDMNTGLLIKSVMGVHTIDSISGDFSLGASGLWIENGKAAYPVRGIAISGNLLELFSSVSQAASDRRFMGNVGAPSLLFSSIEASGA